MTRFKVLPLIRDEVVHIDQADSCCLESWLGDATIVGWQPTRFKEYLDPIAIVAECPKCHTKWWTHYKQLSIPREYLPESARKRLEGKN